MKINIRTIPHSEQHYNTVGDYYMDREKRLKITVSKMGDWRKELAVAIHELWELSLCKDRDISFDEITEFDKKHPKSSEPGDLKNSPYKNEHCSATGIERLFCAAVGLDWKEYDKACEKLYQSRKNE